jgi:translocation and assembly module TamB
MNTRLKRYARHTFVAMALLLAAAGAGAFWILGTGQGRQALLDTIADLTAAPEFRLEMHGLRFGGIWELDSLVVSDASGEWLRAEGIGVRPVIADFLAGRVTLDRLEIGFLSMDRLPKTGESPGGGAMPRLRIRGIEAGHIRLGPAVAGREAKLSLRGGLSLNAEQARADLHAARLDRNRDAIDLEGRINLRDRTMELRLDLREEPEGLLHALLGVNGTEGIALAASGMGPLKACPIELEAVVSDAGVLAANATLNLEKEPEADLRALLTPGPAWTALTGLPAEVLDLGARIAWRDPLLHLEEFDLRSRLADLHGRADWDSRAAALKASLTGTGRNLGSLLPPTVAAGPANASVSLALDPDGLRAVIRGRLEGWSVSGQDVREADADIELDMPADLGSWRSRARVEAIIPALPEGLRSWSANATLGGDFRFLSIDSLQLESERLGLALGGRIGEDIALDALVDLRQIPFPGSPRGISARLDSALAGTLDAASRSLSADMDMNATGVDGLPGEMAELLGREARLAASLVLTPETLSVPAARLEGLAVSELRGTVDLASRRFESEFDARLPRLVRGDLNLDGGVSVSGTAKGSPSSFDVDLVCEAGRFTAPWLDASDIRAEAGLRGLPDRAEATVQATMTAAGQPASLDMAASTAGSSMRITRGRLELPGTVLTLAGDLDPSTLLFSGDAEFRSGDLGVPGRVLGLDMQGELELRAVLAGMAGVQNVRFEATGKGLSAWNAYAGRAVAHGETSWPGAPGTTDVHAELSGAKYGELEMDRIRGRLRGDGQELAFDLDAGHDGAGTDVSARGTLSASPARLRLDSLEGDLLREKLRLESPLDLRLGSDGGEWQEAALTFGQARLTSRGRVARNGLDVSADLSGMNPAQLRSVLPRLPSAQVDARLRIRGTPQAPEAQLEASAAKIRIRAEGLGAIPELGARAEVRLERGVLVADASVSSPSYVDLEAHVSCPMQAEAGFPTLPGDTPLAGRIKGHADLDILPRLLRLDDQAVDGLCELDLRVDGELSDPGLVGTAQVRGGRYENFRSGTAVESADVDLRARGTVLELNATATDGGPGRATGRGTVDLAARTYVFDVVFDAYRLLRLDIVDGTAAGPFRFSGDLEAAALTGSLTLEPVTVNLPRPAAAEAPHIEIREINTNATSTHKARPEEERFLIGMDLNVDIPSRLAVTGRGLDSEWSGRLHIGGNHVSPVITGEMNLLRGTFIFLDRVFSLSKGSLVMNGETPPNPFLDIAGESRVMDTLVQVQLNGPARNFRLSLTSVPPLPQDELLAMILFGRSMREISPLQAVMLAQAAAEMTGIGPDVDFLDSIKSSLGLRDVDVSKDENDNTSVGVGGYVGGKYYIRTQRSVSGQDRTRVEVEISPKISVETEIGADSRKGGGVNWKHDY